MEWVYAFFVAGIILILLPFGMNRYKNIFKNCERAEGRVTKIRNTVYSKNDFLVCPEIEYELNGKTQKAHHYYGIFKADFSVGDNITVMINPKHPSVFRFEDDMIPPKSNTIIMYAMGISAIIAGLVIWKLIA